MVREFTLTSRDGTPLHAYAWPASHDGGQAPIVQIVHGSLEHAGRYRDVAQAFAAAGVSVYACDLRGHGRTAPTRDDLNYFSDGPHGFDRAVEDIYTLTDSIRASHPGRPIVLLGHSMGSFLARLVAARRPEAIAGLILSGTGDGNPLLLRFARLAARVTMAVKGRKTRSPALHQLVYGRLNQVIEAPRTASDFISRDELVVDAYVADPLSGGTVSPEYVYEMVGGMLAMMEPATYRATPPSLPILVFSGEKDPVAGAGGDAADVTRTVERYRAAGVRDLTLTLYPDGRHEMLNELNRDEVYRDVIEWITSRFPLS